ncbi:Zn-dependent oxidoreductase, NADPH:quinone reductase [Mycolicibacterium chubuense NBB4]|uniref:Zn-dependent oxidoreductase, NADPH:quinone reductase n=1 Tax=Mycolicibacterium chubuense (strain NBB4) TaxID=710421 RepID=I4BM67_MYCCN|nr:NADPH:quinone oxidoreductase family protein [Mycolicibacterium chubuense]AFM18374.1 Zn-dependent oxidoreductase, NADPH:quinone reductase [Mycolicibacterium chubuense NBB4]
MRAAVCPHFGPPEVVRIQQHHVRRTQRGEVGVRVSVAAVNFPDVLLIANSYQVSVPPPFVPGSEFAGVVDEIGSGVEGFAVGDLVSGTVMVGAFAQRIVVDAASVALVPDGVDAVTAAASGVAHRTAYHALRSSARLSPGQDVVVLGAGGGVGLAAVQLGVALGARVTAVASSAEKLAVAAHHGAHRTINHRDGELRAALRAALPGGADAVIDPVGGDLSEPALRSLRRGGRFVTVGYASGVIPRIPLNLVLVKGLHVLGFQFQDIAADEFARNEGELREMLVDGRIRPHIGAVYSLDDTANALRHVGEGRAIGKVLIDLS